MLNKPPGLLCVSRDPKAATVMDLLPARPAPARPFPGWPPGQGYRGAGADHRRRGFRPPHALSQAACGEEISSPAGRPVTREHIERFAAGTSLEDGTRCLPAFLRVAEDGAEPLAEISIQEGKYHQIKRMFLSVNRKVLWLKRISMGGLELDPTLPEGACRLLSAAEKEAVLG